MMYSLLLCVISGIIFFLSFPVSFTAGNIFENLPNGILIFAAFVPLFNALERDKGKYAFLKGYVTGFVYYLFGQFWIVIAMKLYGNLSLIGSIGILVTMVLFLSLYTGLYALVHSKLSKRFPVLLFSPALFVSIELLRAHFLTGYPWLSPAYALSNSLHLIQIADLTGIYGLVFVIILTNIALYELLKYLLKKRAFPLKECAVTASVLIVCLIYGFIKISQIDNAPVKGKEKIALIQGNVSQDQKWSAKHSQFIIEKYQRMSLSAQDDNPSLVVWPEAALPYSINVTRDKNIKSLTGGTYKSKFLIGSTAHKRITPLKGESYNSAFHVNPDGSIIDRYDKIHLVPFSEHVLYEKYLPFLRKIIPPVAGDFETGKEIKLFKSGNNKFGVLICFEAIFPTLSREFVKAGADYLVNITNDGWFGKASGPYQHFEMSRFRAIEGRVNLVRAANTGISAFIDPAGRVIEKTRLNVTTWLGNSIQIKNLGSIYVKIGNFFAYLCAIFSVTFVVLSFIKKGD